MDNFALEVHIEVGDEDYTELVEHDLLPLSQTIDIYAMDYDATIRVKNGEKTFFGDVWLILNSQIQKMEG